MISQSGCFGGGDNHAPIGSEAEANAVVDELEIITPDEGSSVGEQYMTTLQDVAVIAREYALRIKLLTWAVVAVVIYLVLKEAN